MTTDQLTEINAAIAAIQNGAQSYKVGTQQVTKAALGTLYQERQRLEQKVALEQNGGIFVARFEGR